MKNFFKTHKTLFPFLIFFLFYFTEISQSQTVTEEWVAIYSGIGEYIMSTDLAVDGFGNVYVVGSSYNNDGINCDFVTIKYNSDGVQQWAVKYDGAGNSEDEAKAFGIDSFGNVYVTGRSKGSGAENNYITIKYNSDGVQQWVARYDGPESGDDQPTALGIDIYDNIYVTGRSSWIKNTNNYDYLTIKYNPEGVQQWVVRYCGPENGFHSATALAIDKFCNIYVTGSSKGIKAEYDYATIKYNSDGVQQWVARYDGPGIGYHNATALAVDNFGNVYVTGNSETSATENAFATVKYNSEGVQQWVAIYTIPGKISHTATALALDNFGNIYITGNSGSTGTEYVSATVVKYNSDGVQQWVAKYSSPGSDYANATAVAIDNSGNVYVTGGSKSNDGQETKYDYTTVKYNSDGVEQWVVRYNGMGNSYDYAKAIVLDSFANLYITGWTNNMEGTWEKITTIKYSQISESKKEAKNEKDVEKDYDNIFILGDVVRLGNNLLLSIEDAGLWKPENPFIRPNKNKIFYSVLIYMKNTGSRNYIYNVTEYSLKDSDGFVYGPSIWGIEPRLFFGSIIPDDIIRGYVTFEIPYYSKGLKFIYSPSLFGNYLTIHLTK